MTSSVKNLFFKCLRVFGFNAFFRLINKGRVKVLLFHSISEPGIYFENSVSEAEFERQIVYLKNKYSFLKLSQDGVFSGYDKSKINILLTFDDGFKDNFNVSAILSKYGITGVFFVIGECLQNGDPPAFIKSRFAGQSIDSAYGTVTSGQALEMIRRGMTIGSHGHGHIDFSKKPLEECLNDAVFSRDFIGNQLDVCISLFAFPWGKTSDSHLTLLSKTYKRIFVTEHGFNTIDDFVFFRNEIANLPHLCCAASGALDFFIGLFRLFRK